MTMCCYRWQVPYVLPNDKVGTSTETCHLKKGHQGPHKSLGGVIEPRKKGKK